MSKIITLTVVGKSRELTLTEKINAAKLARGQAVTNLVWPRQTPYYGDDKDVRRRYYFDALSACSDMHTKIATAIARGYAVHVTVESGTVLTANKDAGIFANVVGQTMLAEIANAAEVVNVPADAENPREYVAE